MNEVRTILRGAAIFFLFCIGIALCGIVVAGRPFEWDRVAAALLLLAPMYLASLEWPKP